MNRPDHAGGGELYVRVIVLCGASVLLVAWLSGTLEAPQAFAQADPSTGDSSTATDAARAVGRETKEAALDFRADMINLPARVWEDVKALPEWKNGAALALGGGFAALADEEWDGRVRRGTRNHGPRFGRTANDILDIVADGSTFYGISAAIYGASLFVDDPKLHAFSLDVVSALTMELPVIFGLKKAFHTHRPNGEKDGFPSGHAAAAASFGALLQSHYGPLAGAAGATFAGLVAYHRIDDRKHDLSDVIFGAAIGYVAGRTAGSVEELPVVHARLVPLEAGPGVKGMALEWEFSLSDLSWAFGDGARDSTTEAMRLEEAAQSGHPCASKSPAGSPRGIGDDVGTSTSKLGWVASLSPR